ncbi:MAG TPA: PA14 domain-containing protein, partial [Rubrivivax sp.]|nr:PA14 domain-containing protein [Rubrivivax sp.]
MARSTLPALLGAMLLSVSTAGQALPTPTTPDPAVLPGIQGHWVDVTTSPHSIGDADNALIGAGGFTIARSFDLIHSVINIGDCCSAASLDPLSALGDDNFAVRYTGYLRIETRGSYRFRMYHDDGIRVILGGETIILYPTDTSPTDSDSLAYDLDAGYYALDIVGWEQGGNFVNRFQVAQGTLPF